MKVNSTSNKRKEFFLNGLIDISLLSQKEYDSFIALLENEIKEYYKNQSKQIHDIPP